MCSQETMGGRILLLTCTGGYVQALDTGGFSVGQPREEGELAMSGWVPQWSVVAGVGEGPEAGEVFSVVRVAETKVAFKSAYGRYMSVSTSGELAGRMEAIGPREQWEAVFEEVCQYTQSNCYYCTCELCPGQGCTVCLQSPFLVSDQRWPSHSRQ